MSLLPMFSYYGSKYMMARKLTEPQYDHVIEPFAGSACYSLYHNPKQVTLVDADPTIAGVWDFLIKASPEEIMRLPVEVSTLDEIHGTCQEAKWLIGFWFNCGTAQPSKRRSNWGSNKQFWNGVNVWSEGVRKRIAIQVPKIKHWKIINGNWSQAPNVEAHWHVDPPYCGTKAGKAYKYNEVDYEALAKWCLKRKGYLQVCEAGGADWLPFVPTFARTKGTLGASRSKNTTDSHRQYSYSAEAVFEKGVLRDSLVQKNDFKEVSNDTRRRERTAKSHEGQAEQGPAKISRKPLSGRQRTFRREIQGTE